MLAQNIYEKFHEFKVNVNCCCITLFINFSLLIIFLDTGYSNRPKTHTDIPFLRNAIKLLDVNRLNSVQTVKPKYSLEIRLYSTFFLCFWTGKQLRRLQDEIKQDTRSWVCRANPGHLSTQSQLLHTEDVYETRDT